MLTFTFKSVLVCLTLERSSSQSVSNKSYFVSSYLLEAGEKKNHTLRDGGVAKRINICALFARNTATMIWFFSIDWVLHFVPSFRKVLIDHIHSSGLNSVPPAPWRREQRFDTPKMFMGFSLRDWEETRNFTVNWNAPVIMNQCSLVFFSCNLITVTPDVMQCRFPIHFSLMCGKISESRPTILHISLLLFIIRKQNYLDLQNFYQKSMIIKFIRNAIFGVSDFFLCHNYNISFFCLINFYLHI